MNRRFTTADENAASGGMTGLVGAFSPEELPMNRRFTTADENAASGGMTGLVGAFSPEAAHESHSCG